MTKHNHKCGINLDVVRSKILNNEFGMPGDRFMSIKTFAQTFSIGMDRAQEIFYKLREEGIIMLKQKNHYLSHGKIPSDSSLGEIRKERKIIALLSDHLESYYIPSFADSVVAHLAKEGYQTIFSIIQKNEYRQVLRDLYDIGIQGFILLSDSDTSRLFYHEAKVPCVMIGYDFTECGIDSVVSGGSEQAKKIADMMIEAGCEEFFFVTPNRKNLEGKVTYNAFFKHLSGKDRTNVSDMVITEKEIKNNSNFLLQKLAQCSGKIGIVCTNEQLTQYVMQWCLENKISVPDKVMLASFRTKSPMNQHRREIITVEENIEKEAAECVALILKRIRGDNFPARLITVEPKVINRLNE